MDFKQILKPLFIVSTMMLLFIECENNLIRNIRKSTIAAGSEGSVFVFLLINGVLWI